MPIRTHRIPGLVLTDHEFSVPLDYERPDVAQVTVFLRLWVTSEYEHDGLRADGERILDRLLSMVRGEV